MADRESRFVVAFDGNAGDLTGVLNALKTRVKTTASELEATIGRVELFKGTQASAKAAADEFRKLHERAAEFRRQIAEIEGAGGKVGKELAASLKATEKAIAATSKEYNRQADVVEKLGAELTKAGVDVANLAAEEVRLAKAIDQANAAAKTQSQRDLLGFKSLRDAQQEIAKVEEAFESLRAGGTLSFGELSTASAKMQQRITELRGSATGIGEAFANLRGQVLAIAGALTGLTIAATQSAKAYRDFEQQVSNVQSIAGVSRARIDQLSASVRELSRVFGVEAVESTRALYQILSSGIPVDNGITVLEASTRAAIAGLTSVETAAKVGVGVLNAYGLQVGEIGRVFDVLFATVRDGVVEFPELAQNIGEVIPTARAAGVSLETLGAGFVVLTRNGINAAETATSLRAAIQALSAPAPEVRARFRDLNITLGDFQKTLEQIASKNLSLSVLRELIPDIRALRGVQILAQNIDLLRDSIGEMNEAVGATQKAYAILADTPQARLNRFNAAIKDLSLSFGEFVTNASAGIQSIANLLNGFNSLDASTRRVAIEFAAFVATVGGLALVLRTLSGPLNLFVGALFQTVPALAKVTLGLDAAALAARGLTAAVAGFLAYQLGTWLRENSPAVQTFGDALGTLAGAGVQSVGLVIEGLTAALTGNADAFRQTRERGLRFTEYLRGEFSEILTGARYRITELKQAQAGLREEFGRATDASVRAAQGVESSIGTIATNTRALLDGVGASIRGFEEQIGTLVARLGEAVSATQTLAQQSIGNIAAEVQAQLAALATVQAGEVQRVRETVDIQRRAAAERLAVIDRFRVDAVAAFEAEARARVEIAQRAGKDVQRTEVEIGTARRGVLQGVLDAYRAHFTQLQGLEAAHIANVKSIQDQRRAINQSVEDKIREARRASLDEYGKYADRVRQIDELLSSARQALARGDQRLAEEFAQKALGLTDQIAGKVEQGGRVIVDAYEASRKAVTRYEEAQSILNRSLQQREDAEREGATAAQRAADQVRKTIADLAKEVDDLATKAATGIQVRIDADSTALNEALAELDRLTAESERLIKVNVDVTAAQIEIGRLKDELAQGVTVNVEARTEKIDAALRRIAEAEPSVSVNVEPALAELEKVRASAQSLERVRMTIDSNAKAVQAEIDLLKRPTESVHTIRVRRVEENAAGGLVGAGMSAARRGSGTLAPAFAAGGAVFRRPAWRKVPGVGSGDTVPAALQAGSYVVRKAAAQHYGDPIMRALTGGLGGAQGYAIGGIVEHILRGFARGPLAGRGRVSGNLGEIDGESLGGVVAEAFRVISPLLAAAGRLPRSRTGQNLEDYLAAVLDLIQRAKSVEDARTLLERIKADADNLFASIQTALRAGVPVVMGATLQGDELTAGRPLAGGGPAGTDTVPAWLTPGEWVIPRRAVARYGAGILEAINSMSIPRATLAAAFTPPRVQRFAEGGPVGGMSAVTRTGGGADGGSGGPITVNVNAAAGALLSAENVRRYIIPEIDKVQRRTRDR